MSFSISNLWTKPQTSVQELALAVLLTSKLNYTTYISNISSEFDTLESSKIVWRVFNEHVKNNSVDIVFNQPFPAIIEELRRKCLELIVEEYGDKVEFLLVEIGNDEQPGILHRIFDERNRYITQNDVQTRIVTLKRTCGSYLHPFTKLSESIGKETLESISERIEALRDAVKSDRNVGVPHNLFKFDFSKAKAIPIRSTGIKFLDAFMGGGTSIGEVYGVLGCFGSGKTTFSIQLACEEARMEYAKTLKDINYLPKYPALVYYEALRNEVQMRLISNLAEIPLEVWIEYMEVGLHNVHLSHASDPSTYKPYEIACRDGGMMPDGSTMRKKPGFMPGEYERIDYAQKVASLIYVAYLNGVDEGENCFSSSELVNSVVNALKAGVNEKGEPIVDRLSIVCIDYVGVAVRRYSKRTPTDENDEDNKLILKFVERAKLQIAGPMKCAVWVFHQIKGAANESKPGVPLDHSQAQGSRDFGEAAAFCFTLGRVDAKSECLVFNCSKARRAKLRPAIGLHQRGNFNMLQDITGYADFFNDNFELLGDSFEATMPTILTVNNNGNHTVQGIIDINDFKNPGAGSLG